MNLHKLLKKTEKMLIDNSPAILTGLGVAGVVTTAYLTGRATFKAADIIRAENKVLNRHATSMNDVVHFSNKEKFELVWKLYIPAVGVGSLSIASIICANRIGTRRAAAVASAYAMAERGFQEYREKVVEKMGEKKEREVREEVAQDRVNRAAQTMVVTAPGSGLVWCHDAFSNQFFQSDMQTLRKAQNDVNAQILHSDFATVSDFYDYVNGDRKNTGLDKTSVSGDMGWNTDKMLEIDFQTVMMDETIPCISVVFAVVPIRDPWRFC